MSASSEGSAGPARERRSRSRSRRRSGLRFRLTAGFFICAILPAGGPHGMLMWDAIVVASLLAHELGHALSGIAWGSRATTVMHVVGGVTRMDPPLPPRRSVVAHLAGPLLSAALGLGAACTSAATGHPRWLVIAAEVNLGWAALNLLPVLPFDGGRLLLELLRREKATRVLAISASVGTALATVGLLVFQSAAFPLVFGGAAGCSLVEWVRRQREAAEGRIGLSARIARAEALVLQGRYIEAKGLAEAVAASALRKETRRKAAELLAWCHLGQNRPERAREALTAAGPLHALDAYCRAAVEAACGREYVAIRILEEAREMTAPHPEAVKYLIDLYARRGSFCDACRVAGEEIRVLASGDTRLVLEAAIEAAAFRAAAQLAETLFERTACADDAIAQAYALAKSGDPQCFEVMRRVTAVPGATALDEKARRRLDEVSRS